MAKEPTKKKHREIAALYKSKVCDQSEEIDPSGERDWFSMSLGFFMGRGLSIDDAHDLSLWVAYEAGDFKAKGYEEWKP